MSEEKFYRCIPELNKECKKSNCFINGGECENTIHKEYALKGLLEEIERLNNIINELEKWLEEQHQFIIEIPAYTKEISIEHKTMEICYENVLDKLQELKEKE